MSLTVQRNPLIFPGGSPSLNRAHPMAQGARYAGVAAPGGFIDLVRGVAGAPTGGSITSKVLPGVGLAAGMRTSGVYVPISNPYSDTLTSVTYAAILFNPSGPQGILFGTNATGNTSNTFFARTTVFEVFLNGIAVACSIGTAQYNNAPVFVACSARSGLQNWVVRNLQNGQTLTATTASASAVGVATPTWSIGWSTASWQPNADIAAIAYSVNNFMSMPALIAWASAPWDYWCPPATQQIISLARKSATSIVTSTGNADGQATVSGAAIGVFATTGAADGQASVNGVGALITILSSAGQADGQASVSGVGAVEEMPGPPPNVWIPPQGPPYLREMTYRHRMLGRSFEPTIHIVKDRPGPIRIIEFVGEMQGGS